MFLNSSKRKASKRSKASSGSPVTRARASAQEFTSMRQRLNRTAIRTMGSTQEAPVTRTSRLTAQSNTELTRPQTMTQRIRQGFSMAVEDVQRRASEVAHLIPALRSSSRSTNADTISIAEAEPVNLDEDEVVLSAGVAMQARPADVSRDFTLENLNYRKVFRVAAIVGAVIFVLCIGYLLCGLWYYRASAVSEPSAPLPWASEDVSQVLKENFAPVDKILDKLQTNLEKILKLEPIEERSSEKHETEYGPSETDNRVSSDE